MSALTHAPRGPLTWTRDDATGTVSVRCSANHPSTLLHGVTADGRMFAPPGVAGSCHCGVCNENLPLLLDGWTYPPKDPHAR